MSRFAVLCIALLVQTVYSAPQFITFNDGKLGVNFGGYHAAVGIGGGAGNGAAGGLFAEAGTPHGQAARAGLGGAVDGNGRSSGGLYAGATAGGNVRAETGLSGGVDSEKSAGSGYATAQAGNRFASAGMGGEASGAGSSGFTFSGAKSYGYGVSKVKHVEVQPVELQPIEHRNVEVKTVAENEVQPLPLSKTVYKSKTVEVEAPAVTIVKEVVAPPPPPPAPVTKVYHKEIIRTHYKPRRHHLRKNIYFNGYVGGNDGFNAPPPPAPVVYKSVQPVIEKRVDVGVSSEAEANAHAAGSAGGQYGYTKQVTWQRNPTFFADIFNIPISTLKAVGNFLGNTAANTNVSVHKTASVHSDKNIESSKHVPSSSLSSTSSETQVSVQTPPVSSFLDDIFAIPINTLGAVNKFLENNVPARKTIQLVPEGEAHVRLGPHARRKANKGVVVVQEDTEDKSSE